MKNKIILTLSTVVSLFFLFFIFRITDDIKRHEQILESSPNVIDVTDTIHSEVLITHEDLPVSEIANATGWETTKIPKDHLPAQKNYNPGNFLYYRIKVPVKSLTEILHLEDQIDIVLGVIQLKAFEVYLNGKFYRNITPTTYTEMRQILPLSTKSDNEIVIKCKLSNGDIGVSHRNMILAGKTGELYSSHLEGYKGDTVFPLVFILCKGSILFLFTLIYFLLNVGKFFEKSILFSICAIGEDVLAGDFLTSVLELKHMAYLHNVFNLGANLFLFLFMAEVIGVKPKKRILSVFFISLFIVSTGIVSDALFFQKYSSFDHYLMFWNLVNILVMGLLIPKAIKVDLVLAFALIFAECLNISTILFSENIGLNYKMYGNLLLFFMVGYQTFVLFRKEQLDLEDKKIQLIEQEKDVAIGRTAGLLAHDVRRPLEQMKLLLDKVTSGQVSQDFIRAAQRDVDFSIMSVNNQINDIMNYSKGRSVELKEISFYRVLEGSLKQVMTINKTDITIEYDLKANVKILGDESQLASALTNLLTNAIEAIRDIGNKTSGRLRISSRIVQGQFVFSIFNDGPAIPEHMLEDIWKPLFSHGKERGTGLGLASVAKTIQDHRGRVRVSNVGETGVIFELSLIAATTSDDPAVHELNEHSKDYTYEIVRSNPSKERPIRIFLLDDDHQVHEYFQFLTKNLPFNVELTYVANFEIAVESIKAKRFDLYILDHDLGGDKTGSDLYRNHLNFLDKEVVIHSNRDQGHHKYKKPMSYEDLENLCEKAYESRRKILLVDDSELTLMTWEMFHGSHNLKVASSPEEALSVLASEKDGIDLCVVDYYFDNSRMTGEALKERILELNLTKNVVIASNSDLSLTGTKLINKTQFEVRGL